MRKLISFILISTLLSACGSSPSKHSVSAKADLYKMVQLTCTEESYNFYKGHIVQEVKLENGTEIKAYTRPVGLFSMSDCIDKGLTSNNVKIAREFVGLGKTALKYVGLYRSASAILSARTTTNNTAITNTTTDTTTVSADEQSTVEID